MSLDWKAHAPDGTLVASCRTPEDAAAIVAAYGDGATIRCGGRIVFKEYNGFAADSYDRAATIAIDTFRVNARERYKKSFGHYPEDRGNS